MTQQAKVLYIIDKGGIGGTTSHLTSLMRSLDRERFAPSLCFLIRGGEQEPTLRRLGVPITILGLRRLYGIRALGGFLRLVRWIRQEQFDIVHTYLFSANVFGVLAARAAGIPVIISSRREVVDWMKPRHRWAARLANRFCHAIVCGSSAIRESVLADERAEAAKLVTIYNGVDCARFAVVDRADRRGSLLGERARVIVMAVGHLSPIKGHTHLLDAAPEVLRRCPETTFVLVGDGPLRQALEAQARRLGVRDRVRFLGKRQDVPRLLAMADVVAIPSRSEGFSNAVLEAMAAGKPVAATDIGGNREAIRHGENGWLMPAADPRGMAEALATLAGDAALRRRLGEEARRTVEERFTLLQMVHEVERLYGRLLTERAPETAPIAVVASQFPELHETSIGRELTALKGDVGATGQERLAGTGSGCRGTSSARAGDSLQRR